MSSVDHIFLYTLLYFLAVIYDRNYRYSIYGIQNYSHSNLKFLKCAFIIGYIVVEGLRYGRGVDQIGNYGPFYIKYCMNPDLYFQNFETLFVWLNQIVYRIDPFKGILPFGSIFMVYSGIFIWGALKFYDNYKQETKCFLLFMLMSTLYLTEWTIRQGVGFAFILVALYYFENKKEIYGVFWGLVGCMIHHGDIIAFVMLIAAYLFFNRKPLSWKITIPLFIFFECSTNMMRISELVTHYLSYLDFSSFGGNYNGYIERNAFVKEIEAMADFHRGFFTQFFTILFYSALIYVGYCQHKLNAKGVYIYNVFVVSIILFEPFRLTGSFSRVFGPCSSLWFLPLSLAVFNFHRLRKNNLFCLAFYITILYIVTYWGRYLLMSPHASYVWS